MFYHGSSNPGCVESVWNPEKYPGGTKDLLGEDVFDTPVWNLTRQQKYDLVYTRILMQHPQVVLCVQPFKMRKCPCAVISGS